MTNPTIQAVTIAGHDSGRGVLECPLTFMPFLRMAYMVTVF